MPNFIHKDTEVPRCRDNQCFFCLCYSSDASPGQQRRNWVLRVGATLPPGLLFPSELHTASAFPFSACSDLFLNINFHTVSLGTASESNPLCSVFAAHQKVPRRLLPACLLLDQSSRNNFTGFSNGLACYWSLNPTTHRLNDSEHNGTKML